MSNFFKKNWLKLVSYSAFLISGLLIGENCLAYNFIEQTDSATSQYLGATFGLIGKNTPTRQQNFNTSTTELNTLITSITISMNPDNGCDWQMGMQGDGIAEIKSDWQTVQAGVQNTVTFNFSSNTTITYNNLLKFYLTDTTCSPASAYYGTLYGTNTTSTYPNGVFGDGAQTIKNLYFKINGGLASNTFIEFTSTPSSTCDFTSWATQSNYTTADANTARLNGWSERVRYGTDPAFMLYQSVNLAPCLDTTVCGSGAGFNLPINKVSDFYEGLVYYAQPLIVKNNTEDWIQANDIKYAGQIWGPFIVTHEGCPASTTPYGGKTVYPGFTWPFSTTTAGSSTSTPDWTCGDKPSITNVGDQVGWYMCKVLQGLFKPNEDSLNKFKTLGDQLKNKPPFGYYTVFSNTLSEFNNVSTTTSTITNTNFQFLAQLDFWNTIETYISYLLYVFTLIYLTKRIMNFSLHG